MNKNVKLIAAVLILALAGFVGFQYFGPSANAEDVASIQPAAGEPKAADVSEIKTAWAVRCNEEGDVKKENKRGVCEIYQRQDMKESGQRVIEFAIGFPEEKEAARGIFILPTGILLQQGVKMTIDDNKPLEFQVRYCIPNGCVAFVSLNDDLLALMSKGEKATVDIVALDGKPITLVLPLKGFSDALGQVKG